MLDLRRRQFLLGGAAATWSLAARAQQVSPAVVGFLSSRSRADSDSAVSAFLLGLNETGYVESHDLTVLYRWADGQYERLPSLAADLIERRVAVIVAGGGPGVPITFVVADDAVKHGLVASLNAPGGNLTGIAILAAGLNAKRLDLLRQLVPSAKVIAFLVNPNNPETEGQMRDALAAASAVGQQMTVVKASNEDELGWLFTDFLGGTADAVLLSADPFFLSRRDRVVALAARQRLPVSYPFREPVQMGGLMSYGTSFTDAYRWAGIYTGRILKGARPADLPVMQSTKFELVINVKTARSLGITVPDRLLALADEVIE
jgi:putative tryptophan/tyrosine transport system substrate-binding protein